MQREIRSDLATYCILFGCAGVVVSAIGFSKLKKLRKLKQKCIKNEINDVSDIDHFLNKQQKDKDGFYNLEIPPVLIQGKLCTNGIFQESVFNSLLDRAPKDTHLFKKQISTQILLNMQQKKQIVLDISKSVSIRDFKKRIKKPLIIKNDFYLENIYNKKEFYFNRDKKNLASYFLQPIKYFFDIFQVFGLKTLKIGLDEKIFTISSNVPVYFLAKIFYHRGQGKFYIVPQNKLCKSMQELLLQFQKEIQKLMGSIQMTIGISVLFLTIGFYLIKDKIYHKYIEIQQKKENKYLDKISTKFSEDQKCIICFCNARNLIFIPCKHIALCSICFLSMKKQYLSNKCPVCKTKIKKCIKINYEH